MEVNTQLEKGVMISSLERLTIDATVYLNDLTDLILFAASYGKPGGGGGGGGDSSVGRAPDS